MRRRALAAAGIALTLVACNAILGLDGDTIIGSGAFDARSDVTDVTAPDASSSGDVVVPGFDSGIDATIDAGDGGDDSPLGIRRVVGDFGGAGNADGTPDLARFTALGSVQLDAAGNRYVIDSGTAIRKIDPAGNVTTFAGKLGVIGVADGKGDTARFATLTALAIDTAKGTLYALEGQGTCRIRTVSLADATVTTVVGSQGCWLGGMPGTGNLARFSAPTGMALGVTAIGSVDVPVLFIADPPALNIYELGTQIVSYACGAAGTAGPGSCKDHPINAFDLYWHKTDGYLYYRQQDRVFRYLPPQGMLEQLTGPILASDADAGLTGASFLDFGLAVDAKTLVVGSRTQLFAGSLDTSVLTTLSSDFEGIGGIAPVATDHYEIADRTTLRGYTRNNVSTIAGRKRTLANIDSADGTLARIGSAASFAQDAKGLVYFFDPESQRIRSYDPLTSKVDTLDKNEQVSPGGDGIVFDGTRLLFSNTTGKGGAPYVQSVDLVSGALTTLTTDFGLGSAFTSDRNGTVYFTAFGNSGPPQVAVVSWTPGQPTITPIAGNDKAGGYNDAIGVDARFGHISGLCYDASRKVLVVADEGNATVRKVDLATNTVSRIAGDPDERIYLDGASARFTTLDKIACDGKGFAFVNDPQMATIRRINLDTGFVDQVAGVRGQQGLRVGFPGSLNQPLAPFVLPNGHLLVGSGAESAIVDIRIAPPQ